MLVRPRVPADQRAEGVFRYELENPVNATVERAAAQDSERLATWIRQRLDLGERRPGDFLVLVSSLNWAVFSALSRRCLKQYPATQMIFYVMAIGWLMSTLLVAAPAGSALTPLADLSRAGWLSIGFLGVFCSGLYSGLSVSGSYSE